MKPRNRSAPGPFAAAKISSPVCAVPTRTFGWEAGWNRRLGGCRKEWLPRPSPDQAQVEGVVGSEDDQGVVLRGFRGLSDDRIESDGLIQATPEIIGVRVPLDHQKVSIRILPQDTPRPVHGSTTIKIVGIEERDSAAIAGETAWSES